MLLREFLYVDVDKVRGLLAQLDEGIVEQVNDVQSSEKLTGGGLKGLAEHSQRWGGERTVQKTQGDVLFPTLEAALDSLGLLTDLSETLQDPDEWDGDTLAERFPPGSLVRITAPSSLFDARYVANTLTAFATTWTGLVNIEAVKAARERVAPVKKGQQGGQAKKKTEETPETLQLEDLIPNAGIKFGGDENSSVSRDFLRGIIQISRGVFTPGLHFNMRPSGGVNHMVSARLQEGRQFLDTDTDILFARYGGGIQEWTMVGSIGHYGEDVAEDFHQSPRITDDDDRVNRAAFADLVNRLSMFLGTLGFVDLPRAPGFSMVPLAVYRVIGSSQPPETLFGTEH